MALSSTLQEWIHPTYWKLFEAKTLREQYIQPAPFEHLILDNFLSEQAFAYLLERAENSPREKNSSRAGLSKDRDILWGYLNDPCAVRVFFGAEFRSFMSHLAGEKALTKPGSFPQLTEFCAGSKGFNVHNDEYEPFDWVFLLYLKNTQKDSKGGAFRLHQKVGQEFSTAKDVVALPNRLLCFKVSQDSHHSVLDLEPHQKRLNLTLDWVLPHSVRAEKRQRETELLANAAI